MHREIHRALTVALLGIAESRVAHDHAVDRLFLPERQRPQRLREHLCARDAHRRLAGLRAHERARDADDVADVEELERLEQLLAQLVLAEVELDASRIVGEMREDRLPLPAPRDDCAPRRARSRPSSALPSAATAAAAVCVRLNPYAYGAIAALDQRIVFVATRLEYEVLLVGGHAVCTPGAARLRYASMNGSIAPSITFATSVILSSVR